MKVIALRKYARMFHLTTLVETGTYVGTTLFDLAPDFSTLYSIELSDSLHVRAQERFAGLEKIRLVHGDSATALPPIVADIPGPALFWLDAHYSHGETARGDVDTPIRLELAAILIEPHRGHVILIDDALEFTGQADYPTIEEVEALVAELAPTYQVQVRDNIIRITPLHRA